MSTPERSEDDQDSRQASVERSPSRSPPPRPEANARRITVDKDGNPVDANTCDEPKPNSSRKRRYELIASDEEEDNEWTLAEDLTKFVKNYTKTKVSHETAKKIGKANPVAKNLKNLIPKMDRSMEAAIKAGKPCSSCRVNEGQRALSRDKTLKEIQDLHQKAMAPLTKVWEGLEEHLESLQEIPEDSEGHQEAQEEADIYKGIVDRLRDSIKLHCLTANTITYNRRLNALSSLPNSSLDIAKEDLREHKEKLTDTDLLFGKDFTTTCVEDAKGTKQMLEHVNIQADMKDLSKTTRNNSKPKSNLFRQLGKNNASAAPSRREHDRGGRDRDSNRDRRDSGRGKGGYHTRGSYGRGRGKLSASSCTPIRKKTLPNNETHEISSRGETTSIQGSLAKNHQGSIYSPNHIRMGDTSSRGTLSIKASDTSKTNNRGELINICRSAEDDKEKGDKPNILNQHPSCVEHLPSSKEGRRDEDNHKLEKPKQVYSLRAFQNGISGKYKTSPQEGRLDGKNRLEGRLLECPNQQKITEHDGILLGRKLVQVPSDGLRTGPGTQNFHKDHESSDIDFEKIVDKDFDLPGRHAHHGGIPAENSNGEGYNSLPFAKPGIHNKLGQIYFDSIAQIRISRHDSRQSSNDNIPSRRENQRPPQQMQGDDIKPIDISERIVSADRETERHKASSDRSPTPIKRPSTELDFSSKAESIIRGSLSPEQGRSIGDPMVDQKPNHCQIETNPPGPSSNDNRDRCVYNSMGSTSSRRHNSWGSMERFRKNTPYKRSQIHPLFI